MDGFSDFLGMIKDIMQLFYDEFCDLRLKKPEEISRFFKENEINARDLVGLINRGTKEYRRTEDRTYNPLEDLGNIADYLRNEGFIYDFEIGAFREK